MYNVDFMGCIYRVLTRCVRDSIIKVSPDIVMNMECAGENLKRERFAMKKGIIIMMALLLSLPSCGSTSGTEETVDTADAVTETAVMETEKPDPFAEFDYEGRTFRIENSINQASDSFVSSNYLIEGHEELTGDAASDAAFARNLAVEELLNVQLDYTQVDQGYAAVGSHIRNYCLAGDDRYELLINDMYGISALTVEGLFYNVLDGKHFDFTQPYWYRQFMEDISINSHFQYMLCGDYFIDLLRCSHCLVFNKDYYTDLFGNSDALYETVINGDWTLDAWFQLVDSAYQDLNGNGQKDNEDAFGYNAYSDWGPAIPIMICADPGYIERDAEGYPVVTMNNERTMKLIDEIARLWQSDGTAAKAINDGYEYNAEPIFTSGRALFYGYQRLGSLESELLRSTEHEIGVVPYPKLDDAQAEYISSSHDTAELGVIPLTLPETELDYVSAVLEVLCRETYEEMLPVYYEMSLKLKYTRDSQSAQMLDIIHDHLGNGFVLAWGGALGQLFLQNTTHAAAMAGGSGNFASKYASVSKSALQKLDGYIEVFKGIQTAN